MAIRFGSSDPKIWLRFRLHLIPMIISNIRKCVFALVTTPFLTDIRMTIQDEYRGPLPTQVAQALPVLKGLRLFPQELLQHTYISPALIPIFRFV